MQLITLPFKNLPGPGDESDRGVQISRWLKSQGLIIGKDYTWRVDQDKKELQFMFNGNAEAWATLITMRDL
jgi:hypothetical protein